MKSEKYLYRVKTKGLHDFYVVARSWEDAATLLKKELDKATYGYSADRTVTGIEQMSSEGFYDSDKRCFDDDHRLIVQPDS